MRFEAPLAELLSAARYAAAPIKRMHIPALECLRMVAGDSAVVVIGGDMDSQARAKVAASVPDPGEINLDARSVLTFLSAVRGEVVSVSADRDIATIHCGEASAEIAVNPDSYPTFAKPGPEREIALGVEAMAFCVPFCSGNTDWRYAGVIFSGGFACARKFGTAARFAAPHDDGPSAMIPREAAPVIAKCGGRLFVSERSWRAEAEDRAAIGKLLEGGDAPPMDPILAKSTMIGEADVADVLRGLDVTAMAGSDFVFLRGDGGKLCLTLGLSGPVARAATSGPIGTAQTDFALPLSARLLRDGVGAHDGIIEIWAADQPLSINVRSKVGITMIAAMNDAGTVSPFAKRAT